MNGHHKTRLLGVAFLLQFVSSFSSGAFVKPLWLVPGDMQATMLKIAENPGLLLANILMDMSTALGVIFLGAVLFSTLKRENEKMALTALAFYILEGALLAISRIEIFSLLKFSQEYAIAGQPETLLTLGRIALEAADFVGDALHLLAFGLGAILFYILLVRSKLVPRWLSLWGLIAVVPLPVVTLTTIFNINTLLVLFLPYFPFEFVIGIWILIKGIPEAAQKYV